jgi:hypothetical protein
MANFRKLRRNKSKLTEFLLDCEIVHKLFLLKIQT